MTMAQTQAPHKPGFIFVRNGVPVIKHREWFSHMGEMFFADLWSAELGEVSIYRKMDDYFGRTED